MEIAREKRFNLALGFKLVKGAYMNEEAKLPDKDNL